MSAGVYVPQFDNTKLTSAGGQGTWDGTKWNSAATGSPPETPNNVILFPTGTWKNGYRPRKMKLFGTHSPTNSFFQIEDTASNVLILRDGPVGSGEEWEIEEWYGADIGVVVLLSNIVFSMTNLLFKL